MRSGWAITSELFDRNGVRTPMQWDDLPTQASPQASRFTEFVEGDLVLRCQRRQSSRRSGITLPCDPPYGQCPQEAPCLRPRDYAMGHTANPSLAAYARKTRDETLLIVNNLSGHPSPTTLQPNIRRLHRSPRQRQALRPTLSSLAALLFPVVKKTWQIIIFKLMADTIAA